MTGPPEGPIGPVGRPGYSAGRAWHYMLSAFLIGWRKRMDTVQAATRNLPKKKR